MARKRAKKKPRKVQAPIDESESDSSSNSRISIPLESDGDSDGSFSEQDTDDPQYIQALRKASDEQLRAILEERTERITGMKPRPFQTDSALSLHKHTDLILVAGTGFGKTLAFVMPCFLWKRNVVLILSPLNALQDEQARKFRGWGLKTAVVNAPSLQRDKKLLKRINKGRYQVIITSPENALRSTHLKPFLTSQNPKHNLIVVIDEAHCIKKWGTSGFRKAYSEIGKIRAFVRSTVPFAAVSATLPPSTLKLIRSSLHIDPHNHTYINLGNFRKNLVWDVKYLSGSESAIPEIASSLPPISSIDSFIPLTLIFVNTLPIGQRVFDFICRLVPEHLSDQVFFLHSLLSQRMKEHILCSLRQSANGIFICSEILAMGVDIPDCSYVIQFLRPSDLDTWMQRGGRGGRGGVNLCRSTLLVQPSALEKPKKKKSNPHLPSEEIEGHEFHDEVERDEELRETGIDDGDDWEIDEEDVDDDQRDVLWRFITTDECLWTIIDRFYKNPAREALTEGCCSNCEQKRRPVPIEAVQPIRINQAFYGRTLIEKDMERTVTAALEKWREEVWEAEWADGNVSITFIVTDKVLQAVARAAETIQIVKDLRETTPPFGLWKRYGSSVLDIIRDSRQQVYSRYQAMQAESVQRQIKTAEEREAQKQAGREKVEKSRLRKKYESALKRHRKVKETWEKYTGKIARGERHYGKPPRQPSPTPSPPPGIQID